MKFKLLHQDKNSNARCGEIETTHGKIPTPIFMPVGTHGTVKAHTPAQLHELNIPIILANTYHLFLTPGHELIKKAKGLHKFMNWPKSILTDSGGFQVFSLNKRTITEEGVRFPTPQGEVFLSPEKSMEIQEALGSDIIMAFDECTPYPASHNYAKKSLERTFRWLKRCQKFHTRTDQALFGIIQGSTYPDLRKMAAEQVCSLDLPGVAIGGVSVGEGPELMEEVVSVTTPFLPKDKPRYVMGVGTPEDLLILWENGIDMSDCIIPTKYARGGTFFTNHGKIRITHRKYRHDFYPLMPNCSCYVCKNFTRSYLKHLFDSNEILGAILATHHNLHFYNQMCIDARESIMQNRFKEFKKNFLNNYQRFSSK